MAFFWCGCLLFAVGYFTVLVYSSVVCARHVYYHYCAALTALLSIPKLRVCVYVIYNIPGIYIFLVMVLRCAVLELASFRGSSARI